MTGVQTCALPISSVGLSRRLVELGRAARAESKVKIRQPLARALVSAHGWESMDGEIRAHIADELNVVNMEDISTAGDDLVNVSIKANFRSIGARYGADVQAIAKAISAVDANTFVKDLRATGNLSLAYDGKSADLILDDVVITETPKTGWSVASHGGESVALDLALSPELIAQGLVREVIRAIQEERKNSGFDISDRIVVRWRANAETAQAIKAAQEEIAREVLATEILEDASIATGDNELELGLQLTKK